MNITDKRENVITDSWLIKLFFLLMMAIVWHSGGAGNTMFCAVHYVMVEGSGFKWARIVSNKVHEVTELVIQKVFLAHYERAPNHLSL